MANNASRLSPGTDSLKITKRLTIENIETFDKHIGFLDKEIKKRLADDEVAKIILSYPGAGMILASTFIAETKGLKFESKRDFMSFCGLCSNTNQSSKLEKDKRITEGNKHIRMAFFQAVNSCIKGKKGNQTIRNYHKKKLSEYEKTKYRKKKAKIASAAKLAGIIFAMVKKM
ncbi:MAG: IS110 family transposase [Candidatus Altarchaeum sp.]|nr:IS110 family transposase [Candidatus Altarchaeum sp.]